MPNARVLPVAALLALLLVPSAASAARGPVVPVSKAPIAPGAKREEVVTGPVRLRPGQNTIELDANVPQPKRSGYIVRMRPDLIYKDGTRPPVDVVHLHHAVWFNASRPGANGFFGRGSIFFASGEEKTIATLPRGYGLPYKRSDRWVLNPMLHNLTAEPVTVYLILEVDIIPRSTPAARGIKPVRPLWMDVERGKFYPVFDVPRGGGQNGRYTYPDDDPNAYPRGGRRNTWTVDRDSVIVFTGGHMHPGGLYTDLWVRRPGEPEVRHLFRSEANYYEPAGAVSWDVAMTVTPPDYRVQLRKGDEVSVSVTYDSSRASWYESMGIMPSLITGGHGGKDPFKERVDVPGVLSHGRLPENRDSGGRPTGLPNPFGASAGGPAEQVTVKDFLYQPGDLNAGELPPVVQRGQSLRFVNQEPDPTLFHSITACKAPCNRSGGIRYPLADGPAGFDSGNIGFGPPGRTAAANRDSWDTPKDLPDGTYSYFCRQHPFMRGAFRVVG